MRMLDSLKFLLTVKGSLRIYTDFSIITVIGPIGTFVKIFASTCSPSSLETAAYI